jgi:hypothetical protein
MNYIVLISAFRQSIPLPNSKSTNIIGKFFCGNMVPAYGDMCTKVHYSEYQHEVRRTLRPGWVFLQWLPILPLPSPFMVLWSKGFDMVRFFVERHEGLVDRHQLVKTLEDAFGAMKWTRPARVVAGSLDTRILLSVTRHRGPGT